MKSIIEEASSIAKAIENGWIKAGKPKEFSIKIFEEPQKNFLGITKRSAKVGIFYNDNYPVKTEQVKSKPSPRNNKPIAPNKAEPYFKAEQKANKPKEVSINEQAIEFQWTKDMILTVQNWLKEILQTMESQAHFSTSSEDSFLKIKFDKDVVPDKGRERQFFSGLSMLLYHMLKNEYKKPLKGFKILFTGA